MKKVLLKFMMLLCLLFIGMGAWAYEVTYTVTSTSAVSTSGTAPQGSSATFANTYTTKDQLTSDKTMTLTLSGYAGMKITGITLSMKSNSKAGAGYLSVKAGSTTLASIGTAQSGVAFNNASWNGSYTTSYTNVTPTMTNNSYVIKNGENVVIVIGATVNSLYCQSFKISYLNSEIPSLGTPSNLTSTNVTDRSATLTWDAVSNAESYKVKVGTTEYETNTNSYTVTGLDYNTDYSWSVKALAGSSTTYSDGNYSAESNFRTTDFVASAGTYNIVPINTFFNCEAFTNKPKDFTGATGTKYGITIEYVAAANAYINSAQCRAYSGTKLIFTAPSGFKLTNITFTADGDNWAGTHTADVGTMTNTKTWNGCSDVVSITFAGTCRITNIQLTYIPATADVTIGATGYATFVAPYNMDFTGTTVTAYLVTPNLAEKKVTLTSVDMVPAGTALVVKGTSDAVPTTASAAPVTTALEVSATAITATEEDTETYYYLGQEAGVVGFRPLNVDGTLAAGKCFFKVATAGARFMRIVTEGETTAISAVENSKMNNVVYNLAGQRVAADAKGIVIVNGKKMLNK